MSDLAPATTSGLDSLNKALDGIERMTRYGDTTATRAEIKQCLIGEADRQGAELTPVAEDKYAALKDYQEAKSRIADCQGTSPTRLAPYLYVENSELRQITGYLRERLEPLRRYLEALEAQAMITGTLFRRADVSTTLFGGHDNRVLSAQADQQEAALRRLRAERACALGLANDDTLLDRICELRGDNIPF